MTVTLEALERLYEEAMMGSEHPGLVMTCIPGLGNVCVTEKGVRVNDYPATTEQIVAIREWMLKVKGRVPYLTN